jgi:hypothetical protein
MVHLLCTSRNCLNKISMRRDHPLSRHRHTFRDPYLLNRVYIIKGCNSHLDTLFRTRWEHRNPEGISNHTSRRGSMALPHLSNARAWTSIRWDRRRAMGNIRQIKVLCSKATDRRRQIRCNRATGNLRCNRVMDNPLNQFLCNRATRSRR